MGSNSDFTIFNWTLSNQINSNLPTCTSLQFKLNGSMRDPMPPYHLTIFANGKEPRKIYMGSDLDNLSWVVAEPVGSKLALSVTDASGTWSGGLLSQVFNVVAGSAMDCVETPFPSTFIFTTHDNEGSPNPDQFRIDVEGGIPPYVATILSFGSSTVTVTKKAFDDTTFLYSARPPVKGESVGKTFLFNRNVLVLIDITMSIAAISDSTGKWASGTAFIPFGEKPIDRVSEGTTGSRHRAPPASSGPLSVLQSQTILAKRSSDDDDSAIIVVDVVALILLLGATLAVIFCKFVRKRRHRRQGNADSASRNDGGKGDLEAAQEGSDDNAERQEEIEGEMSKDDKYRLPSQEIELPVPTAPPSSPAVPPSSYSPQSRWSSFPISAGNLPDLYGDPYPDSLKGTYRRSDTQSILSRKSSTSLSAAKAAKPIRPSISFSGSFLGEEPALSETSCGVLSRNASASSRLTITSRDMRPSSSLSGSTPRESQYRVSHDAPAVPPLVISTPDDPQETTSS